MRGWFFWLQGLGLFFKALASELREEGVEGFRS